jgi:hypothetical protein
MVANWEVLAKTEREPLFSWIHSYEIMELMEPLCADEESAKILISRFGGTLSVTHASALCGALVGLAGRIECNAGVGLLLLFFDQLRFRCHLPTMTTLLSKVNYLIQAKQAFAEDEALLVQLCLAAVDMCEQMPREDWVAGRAVDTIQVVELIWEDGLKARDPNASDGSLLPQLIARGKAMNERIRNIRPEG